MIVQESEEMYLETIFRLGRKMSKVRAVDVAGELGYSRPSVSRAVGLLKEKGYITVEGDRSIRFTEEGRRRAEAVYEKHRVITELFVRMGAERSSAEQNACRIEHVISSDMFEVLKNYLKTL